MSKFLQAVNSRVLKQAIAWVFLPLIVVFGWWFPWLGFGMVVCMAAALGIAFVRGRWWCDWLCARGAFYDVVLKPFSRNREIPQFFWSWGLRGVMMAVLMAVMGLGLYKAWPNWNAMGMVFVRMMTVTTLVGIIFGVLYNPRVWCAFCPVGTMANLAGRWKYPLNITPACTDCKLCEQACPMGLAPYEHKESAVTVVREADCLKCGLCVVRCPKSALFLGEVQPAGRSGKAPD